MSLFALETLAGLFLLAVPGTVSWWWGRDLVRALDDPTLPERLAAHRGRVTGAWMVAVALAALLLPHAWLPLAGFASYVGLLVGGFHTRRILFKETWDLPTYLGFWIRLLVAFGGPWLLLAIAPALVASRAGRAAWVAAGALFVVLILWQRAYSSVLLRLMEARPLDRAELLPRLDAVAAKSSITPPRLFVVDPPGGRWANAVALPRMRPPSAVLFTRTLLDELTVPETAAIFGHELAHLEHYDRRRLLRASAAQAIVALLACAIPLLLPESFEPWRGIVSLLLAPVILGALAAGIARRRTHEGESDLRAVELCGDAEALASALAKIHALARLPRRMATESESRHSHPSLARRLQAIRRAGGIEPLPSAASPVLVLRGDSGRWAVLGGERAEWLEGVAALSESPSAEELRSRAGIAKSYAYGELLELRLDVARGGPSLVARTRAEKWSLPLQGADEPVIAALQAKLDELDGKLALVPAEAAPPSAAARLCSLLLLVLSMVVAPSLPAASAAALALVRPAAAALAAAGGTALAAALIHVVSDVDLADAWMPGVVVALALLLLREAWSRRKTENPSPRGRLEIAVAVLGVTALPSAVGLLAAHTLADPIAIASPAVRFPGISVALFGAASALAISRGFLPAGLAAVLALAPFAVTGLGGAGAPRMAPGVVARNLSLVPLAPHEIGRVTLPRGTIDLRPSPGGSVYALDVRDFGGEDEDDDAAPPLAPPRFEVGPLEGSRATLEAFALEFLDDRRVLVLANAASGMELREVDLVKPDERRWSVPVPRLAQPHLTLAPGSSSFWLVGRESRGRAFVRLRGKVGDTALQEDRWPLDGDSGVTPFALFPTEGARAVAIGMRNTAPSSLVKPWMLALVDPTRLYRWELWAIGGGPARTMFAGSSPLSCAPSLVGSETVVCTAFEGKATTVLSIDPAHDRVSGSLRVDRAFSGGVMAAGSGARLVAANGVDVVLLDLTRSRGHVIAMGGPDARTWVRGVALAGSHLDVLLTAGTSASAVLMDVPAGG